MYEITPVDLVFLRRSCKVRKHPGSGLSLEEYERGVYLVKGTVGSLMWLLKEHPEHTIKVKVILEEES